MRNPELAPAFHMSSTTTTATSPSTPLPVDRFVSYLPAARNLLTSASRPSAGAPVPGFSAISQVGFSPERPSKRIRLDTHTHPQPQAVHDVLRFTQCLERQVFPYIDKQISALPRDGLNTLEIGKKVIALLTGPEFAHEYKRGNGSISAEFEAQLAIRAAVEVRALSLHPDYQVNFPNKLSSEIPLPSCERPTASPSAKPTPPISSSPFPVKAIPFRSPTKLTHTTNGITQRLSSVPYAAESRQPLEVIVIDDDDDEEEEEVKKEELKEEVKNDADADDYVDVDIILKQPVIVELSDDEEPHYTPPQKLSAGDEEEARSTPPQKASVVRTVPEPAEPLEEALTPAEVLPSEKLFEKPATTRATPPRMREAQVPADTDFRRLAHSLIWESRKAPESTSPLPDHQPYLSAEQRQLLLTGNQQGLLVDALSLDQPRVVHVEFSKREIQYLCSLARQTLRLSKDQKYKDPTKDLRKVLKANFRYIPRILDGFSRERGLPRRSREDIEIFFRELIGQKPTTIGARLTIERDDSDLQGEMARSSRVHSLLFAREVAGQQGYGSMRRAQHFNNELRKCREDEMKLRADWTGCAGDISTIAWVSNSGFICGTTEHSDSHNQQYNKPGNLVLGSCDFGTLRAYPEHRIVRPIVEKGENSTDAMIQSQDPWLYSSVVSSDFDAVHGRAFTSGFDRSVKIWNVEQSGASMTLLGEWGHGGNVNFVAASKHASGMVATAADVAAEAVRIYDIHEPDPSRSPFRSYSCSRVVDAEGNTVSTEKWAYFPATMHWGLSESVQHLLLVGYSPRSRTGDDADIPEDRRDSGELCLWDGLTGERWRITSATALNVFEVLWHPTQPCFIAATSPLRLGMDLAPSLRTQIRIFRPADSTQYGFKAFSPVKSLDCAAIDINELTIMPNSFSFCYVTAGCTDGCTYVWDTARGDKPIHVLRHGEPIDEYRGDREREDVGVKFTAWGTSPDRFYTGSSDGVVKAWNVRSRGRPLLVRELLKTSAPITAGMFSPDKSRLVVGDASGSVFMLSLHEEDEKFASFVELKLPGSRVKRIRRPVPIIRHPEPPPPTHDAKGDPIVAETGISLARSYIENQQLKRHPNPTVGAVQGPRYAETGLFRRELHFLQDPTQPLLAIYESMQQDASKGFGGRMRHQALALRSVKEVASLEALHRGNLSKDLDLEQVTEETKSGLQREGIDLDLMTDYLLIEEEVL